MAGPQTQIGFPIRNHQEPSLVPWGLCRPLGSVREPPWNLPWRLGQQWDGMNNFTNQSRKNTTERLSFWESLGVSRSFTFEMVRLARSIGFRFSKLRAPQNQMTNWTLMDPTLIRLCIGIQLWKVRNKNELFKLPSLCHFWLLTWAGADLSQLLMTDGTRSDQLCFFSPELQLSIFGINHFELLPNGYRWKFRPQKAEGVLVSFSSNHHQHQQQSSCFLGVIVCITCGSYPLGSNFWSRTGAPSRAISRCAWKMLEKWWFVWKMVGKRLETCVFLGLTSGSVSRKVVAEFVSQFWETLISQAWSTY